jgi:hypothetical protein
MAGERATEGVIFVYQFHDEEKAITVQEAEGVWGRLLLFSTNQGRYSSGVLTTGVVTVGVVTAEVLKVEVVTAFIVIYRGHKTHPAGGSFKCPVLKLELG